jgi:hypothetical protein
MNDIIIGIDQSKKLPLKLRSAADVIITLLLVGSVDGSEVEFPSCTVGFWVGFTRERRKSQITNMIKIVVLFDANYEDERLKMQMFPTT